MREFIYNSLVLCAFLLEVVKDGKLSPSVWTSGLLEARGSGREPDLPKKYAHIGTGLSLI